MTSEVSRMKKAVADAGLSYMELERLTGVSHSTLQRYLNGKTNRIPLSAVEKVAAATGVSPAWIMGWEEPDTARSFPTPQITEDYTTFPVIGEIAAGYDSIAIEDWQGDTVDIPNSYLRGRKFSDFFVLRVKGDSMFPTYQDGDKVLVLKQSTLNYSGQVGAILYDGELATLKKIEYAEGEDWLRLVPINPTYPTQRIVDSDLERCRVIGIPRMLVREIEE